MPEFKPNKEILEIIIKEWEDLATEIEATKRKYGNIAPKSMMSAVYEELLNIAGSGLDIEIKEPEYSFRNFVNELKDHLTNNTEVGQTFYRVSLEQNYLRCNKEHSKK